MPAAAMLPDLLLNRMITAISTITSAHQRSSGKKFANSATITVWFSFSMM